MAQKRMFSLSVTDTDSFLDMPTSAQALYFHLGMHGDDDGFVSSPRKIMRDAGCNADDLKVLISKSFIIPFDSGIVVIRDWRLNNDLKNDRYHETIYTVEKASLVLDPSKRYRQVSNLDTKCIQPVSNLDTEHNIAELSITEINIEGADKPPRAARFTPPTIEEVQLYCAERQNNIDAQRFVDFYLAKGWKVGKNLMKDWKAAVRTWENRDKGNKDLHSPDKYKYTEEESL